MRRKLAVFAWLLLGSLAARSQEISPPQELTQAQEVGQAPELDVKALFVRRPIPDLFVPEIAPPPRPSRVLKTPPAKYDLPKIGHRGIGSGMNFYSLERERQLGRELANSADHGMKLLEDPVVNEYVNRVSQNIALNSDIKVPLTVKVVSDDEINAFSLPGGYLYVTTGLINEAGGEAQLAGVIGHEIAHIAARHGTRTVSKGMLWSVILRGAAAGATRGRSVGTQIGSIVASEVTSYLVFTKMERGAEDEADFLAVEYIYAAGYDPGEYVAFFERVQSVQKKKPSAIGKIFASHPPTESRIAHTQRVIQDFFPDRPQYLISTSGFEDMQTRMRTILNRKSVQDPAREQGPVLLRKTTEK